MPYYATLDLDDLADSWSEGLSILADPTEVDYVKHDTVDATEEIRALADQLGYCDPNDLRQASAVLVLESDVEEYAKERAESETSGVVDLDVWPFTCIDWSEAASELVSGRATVDHESETYVLFD